MSRRPSVRSCSGEVTKWRVSSQITTSSSRLTPAAAALTFEAEAGDFLLHRVERNFHADHPEHRAFGDLVAHDAVLAEIIVRGLRRRHDMQEGTAVDLFGA